VVRRDGTFHRVATRVFSQLASPHIPNIIRDPSQNTSVPKSLCAANLINYALLLFQRLLWIPTLDLYELRPHLTFSFFIVALANGLSPPPSSIIHQHLVARGGSRMKFIAPFKILMYGHAALDRFRALSFNPSPPSFLFLFFFVFLQLFKWTPPSVLLINCLI